MSLTSDWFRNLGWPMIHPSLIVVEKKRWQTRIVAWCVDTISCFLLGLRTQNVKNCDVLLVGAHCLFWSTQIELTGETLLVVHCFRRRCPLVYSLCFGRRHSCGCCVEVKFVPLNVCLAGIACALIEKGEESFYTVTGVRTR